MLLPTNDWIYAMVTVMVDRMIWVNIMCVTWMKIFCVIPPTGHDLSSVVASGDKWCLCPIVVEAVHNRAPKVVLDATWNCVKKQVKEHLKISNKKMT